MFLLKVINAHSGWVSYVINITDNRFVSCSCARYGDNLVKLWQSEPPYEHINTFTRSIINPIALLQLKKKENILVISCFSGNTGYLHFYSLLDPFGSETIFQGIYATNHNGLVELENGNLVAFKGNDPLGDSLCTIFVVDCVRYVKIMEIVEKDFIPNSCALCVWKSVSFICAHDRYLFQVMNIKGEYKIAYRSKVKEKRLYGEVVLDLVENGKYIVTDNGLELGINVFEVL